MLRKELQSYFDRVYPHSKIETQESLYGQVHIRFELGGEKGIGTIERINQATERAFTIFKETFNDFSREIFVLIYEYQGKNCFNVMLFVCHVKYTLRMCFKVGLKGKTTVVDGR